jgi:hypothetical protein
LKALSTILTVTGTLTIVLSFVIKSETIRKTVLITNTNVRFIEETSQFCIRAAKSGYVFTRRRCGKKRTVLSSQSRDDGQR